MNALDPNIALQAQVPSFNPLQAYAQGLAARQQMMQNQLMQRNLNSLSAYSQAMNGAVQPDGTYSGQNALTSYLTSGQAMPDTTNAMLAGTGQNTSNLIQGLLYGGDQAANQAIQGSPNNPIAAAGALAASGYGASGAGALSSGLGAQNAAIGLGGEYAANQAAQDNPGDLRAQAQQMDAAGFGATGMPITSGAATGLTGANQSQFNLTASMENRFRTGLAGLALSGAPTLGQMDAFIDHAAIEGWIPEAEADAHKAEVASLAAQAESEGKNPSQLLSAWARGQYAGSGPAELGQMLPGQRQLSTGLGTYDYSVNPLTGGNQAEVAAAPNLTPTAVVNPQTGEATYTPANQVNGRTAAAPEATAAANAVGNTAGGLLGAASHVLQNAPQQIAQLDDALHLVESGAATGKWSGFLPGVQNGVYGIFGQAMRNLAGAPTSAAQRAELVKDLSAGVATQAAVLGLNATDAQMAQSYMSSANPDMPKEAILHALALQKSFIQYQQYMSQHISNTAATAPGQLPNASNQFTSKVGVLPFLLRNMAPSERANMIKSMPQAQADQLKNQVQMLQSIQKGGADGNP